VNSATLGRTGFTQSDYAWGFNGGVGGNYNITESLFVGLEGTFVGTSRLTFNGTPGGTNTAVKTNLNGIIGTINIGYRF
jgi:outer membrane protein W